MESVGLRERKKARTREALAEAALDLFERQGFESTTVDEVAAAAEVSRRTFFRYYPTKEAVLFPERDQRLATFRELLATSTLEQSDERSFEAVRRACLAMAHEYVRDRRNLLRQNRIIEASPTLIAYEREIDRDWEQALAEALQSRLSGEAAERQGRILAGAVIGVVRAVLREWFTSDGEADLIALGQDALGWLEDGFAAH